MRNKKNQSCSEIRNRLDLTTILIMVLSVVFLLQGCDKQEKIETEKPVNTNSQISEKSRMKSRKSEVSPPVEQSGTFSETESKTTTSGQLPKMVDLGADKCIPCKAMAPILEELREEYKGKVDVVFIDVWKNPEPGRKANVRVIPTQIFYDTSGKELFRHEGFYSKKDILAKWKELGFQYE